MLFPSKSHLVKSLHQKRRNYRDNNTKQQCPPKAIYLKAAEKIACQHNDKRIDYEQEKSECNNRYRNGKKNEYWFQKRI